MLFIVYYIDIRMRACSRLYPSFFSDINEKLDKQVGSGKIPTRQTRQRIHTIVNNIRDAGFTRATVDRYSLLTDKMLGDFNEKSFAVEIIKNYARRFPYKDNISTTLRQFGLTSVKASHVQTIFEPMQGDSYTNAQIIDLAIEYLFGLSSPLLGDKTTIHYYNPEIVDTWFEGKEGKFFYNFPGRCDKSTIKNIYTAIQSRISSPSIDTHEIYYHMTSWYWANEICDQIVYSAGMPCLDFGWNGSFYLSNKLKNAIDWSKKKSKAYGNEIAIVVFNIPKVFPSHLKYKELAGEEWITITKKSRICNDDVRNKEIKVPEIPELRRIDFIYGPMVSNGQEVASTYVNPKTHNPPKYQLASKTDAGCNYLYDNILGIIFFQKYIAK